MEKGKYGVSPVWVAVLAFVFAALNQPVAVLLICGFALLAEKNPWLNRQVLQALFLSAAGFVAGMISDWVFGSLARSFRDITATGGSVVMNSIQLSVTGIVRLVVIVFCIIAILRNLYGKEADLPLAAKLTEADWVLKKTAPAPQPAPAAQAPAEPAEASAPAVAEAPAAKAFCPACGNPATPDSAFCTTCGKKTN